MHTDYCYGALDGLRTVAHAIVLQCHTAQYLVLIPSALFAHSIDRSADW